MSINKIKQKLLQNSIKDSGWLEKAKWRQENEDWLDISFSIAVRVASILASNKKADKYPKSQTELAEAMGCSAQYVNKLLKGQERLQIDTICKIGRILGLKLIEVPKSTLNQTIPYTSIATLNEKVNIFSQRIITSKPYANVSVNVKMAGEGNYALAA